MKKHLTLLIIFAVAVCVASVSHFAAPKMRTATVIDCFDTVSEITVYSRGEKAIKDCEKYLRKAEKMFSSTDSKSELYRLNHGENPELSEDTRELLDYAEEFTEDNGEYFSVYLNPLIEAWDFKNNTGTIPDVEAALERSAQKNSYNLGAVAKGYAADRLCEILKKDGVSSALISLGGNAYALGKKPTGENWKIGIQSPKDAEKTVGVISAENIAVITSGDYQRYFEADGVRYHHILNPRTGYPVNCGLHSVTVIGENAAECDALATAAFAAGLENGNELLKKYGVCGIFITDDTVYFSKSLENIFKQTDFSYKYEFLY